jgi:endoglucanase
MLQDLATVVTVPQLEAAAAMPQDIAPGPATSTFPTDVLMESWAAYRQRFIQADGRVIDWEARGRTVSEGQAYAMLRAVLVDDPGTFDRTLTWAETNLSRSGQLGDNGAGDRLWAWHWGQRADGTWGILDHNFATDADIDAITALILAGRRWGRSDYLELAQLKLNDLWAKATLARPTVRGQGPRYLLPGSLAAFQPNPGEVYLNPSYLAPYAFRLFAQVDADHDWLSLVDSSYDILEQASQLSSAGLPLDWVVLNLADNSVRQMPEGAALQSRYGFDAYRVWWRLAWDAAWFEEPRAQALLARNLTFLADLWQQQRRIPALFTPAGEPLVGYEATAQYAMLYLAFLDSAPATAQAIYQSKLVTAYTSGIWDNADAYYVQNLAWLGLYPAAEIPSDWIRGAGHSAMADP